MAPSRLADDRELVLRVMPMPADVNGNGDIFGGWVMAQVDVAGAVLPYRIAKGRIATVAVNQFIFKQPVSLGDLLSFYAKVTRIGTTSVGVHVDVYAERNPANLQVVKVTEADLTYVIAEASVAIALARAGRSLALRSGRWAAAARVRQAPGASWQAPRPPPTFPQHALAKRSSRS
ncbi:MAG: hypothetical protein IPM15_17550 [Betaproteobacteria bacterium]|nr:hypothetical protein [Betaproteobacteria bacterium]